MFALNSKLRASALCLLLVIFTACEYAPAPTSTPLPTATSSPTTIPTATAVVTPSATPIATATIEAPVGTESATIEATAASGPAAAITGHVTVSSTRIRDIPSIRGKMVGQLKRDDPVIVVGITADGGYLLIQSADGSLKGWTAKQSIALDNPLVDIPVATPAA